MPSYLRSCLFISVLLTTILVNAQDEFQGKLGSRPDCRETNLVNKPRIADSYPYLSADGLRLYFTSNREGGHGRFFISTRKNIADPFGQPVVLSTKLTDGYYAGTLTKDELTLCMVKSGDMFISKRTDPQSEFGTPVLIEGTSEGFHYGPSISPDGNEIIVTVTIKEHDVIKIYRTAPDGVYREAGMLPTPEKSDPGPGQLSKDGLSYYFSFDNGNGTSIWRYTRKSVKDNFVDLEELPIKVNAFVRSFQPTVNGDASIIVYTTSQNNSWDEDDIVLVNDPRKSLAAPEQITSVQKNNDNSLTVMNKVARPEARVYPNPFQSEVIFEMSEQPASGAMFRLYDLSGKLIKQQAITNMKTTVQLNGLPLATYIYQVLDNNGKLISSGKLVKG